MTIIIGSRNVSEPIRVVMVDGNGVLAPVNLTGMAIVVAFWDVGRVGNWGVGGCIWDYGAWKEGCSPLLLMSMDDASVVVDTPTEGILHLNMTTAQSSQLACNSRSLVWQAKRRLVRDVWRADTGLETLLMRSTEYAGA